MWDQIMIFLTSALAAVVSWFDTLISSMGAGSIILAGIGITLVVSLLLIPIRGGSLPSFSADLTVNRTSQYKTQRSSAVSAKKSAVKSAKQYARK